LRTRTRTTRVRTRTRTTRVRTRTRTTRARKRARTRTRTRIITRRIHAGLQQREFAPTTTSTPYGGTHLVQRLQSEIELGAAMAGSAHRAVALCSRFLGVLFKQANLHSILREGWMADFLMLPVLARLRTPAAAQQISLGPAQVPETDSGECGSPPTHHKADVFRKYEDNVTRCVKSLK
jgi:hypothetical protein